MDGMCAQMSLASGRKNRSVGWTPPEVGQSRTRWGGAGGSGQGTGLGSSDLGSVMVVGAPCSTAPPGSPPLTGGSSAETWSGSSAGVCSQVWGSGYTVSGGLARTGLCQASPHRCCSPAQPPSLIRQNRTSVDQSQNSWARGRGWGWVHFRQVFSDSQGGEGEGQRTNGQIFQFHFSWDTAGGTR